MLDAFAISTATAPEASVAPDFVLTDDRGQAFRLGDAFGTRTTIVTFFRGHWCPYCRRYLSKLQGNLERFAAHNAILVAISPESPAMSRQLAADLGLAFPLLSDVGGDVICRYGTRNGFAKAALLPHPSVFIVGPDGNVRFKSIDRNYKKRTTMRTILGVLEDLTRG